MIRVKICCIRSIAESALAVQAGAAALGLVSEMPSGPGVIDEPTIRTLAAATPPGVASFLLTSLQSVEEIVRQHHRCRTSTVQIVDGLVQGTHAELREALPGIALVQVVHVTGRESVAEAVGVAPQVDALLLDSGNPRSPIKELGGTGRVHDWELSREIVASVPVPVFLAGGLRPDNVAEAIRRVRPFGVDVCSGVRSDGALDPGKLAALFAAVGRAQEAP